MLFMLVYKILQGNMVLPFPYYAGIFTQWYNQWHRQKILELLSFLS